MNQNGHATADKPTARELREKRRCLQESNAIKRLEHESKLMESNWSWLSDDFATGGDIWERIRERFDVTGEPPPAQPSDRQHGQNWPLWRNELDLARYQQKSRVLCSVNGYARGLLRNLTNYTTGRSCTYNVQAKGRVDANKDKPGQQLSPEMKMTVERFQDFIDDWLKKNRWNCATHYADNKVLACTREREAYRRTKRDGEAIIRIFRQEGGLSQVRFVEPQQVRQPPGATEQAGWSFGIQHQMEPFEDVETPLQYCIYYADSPEPEFVHARDIIHIRNIDDDAGLARGTPEFAWDALSSLERASKLQRNISAGSAIRAATAETWEHANHTQAQVTKLSDGLSRPNISGPDGRPIRVEEYPPGTIRRVPANQKLVPPAYSTGVEEQLSAVQGDLRQAATSMCAPEYMTGSTNDANMATAREAGTPFVVGTEAEQEHFKAAYLCVVWRAVAWAVECGRLPKDALELVEIQVEAPSPERRDPLNKTQEQQLKVMSKLKSPQSIMMENGDDPEVEMTNMLEWQEKMGGADSGTPLGLDDGTGEEQDQFKPGRFGPRLPRMAGHMRMPAAIAESQEELRSMALDDTLPVWLREAAWEEAKHKRDHGKFAEKGGATLAERKVRAPHELTQNEYDASGHAPQGDARPADYRAEKAHRLAVTDALAAGKIVPPEVLADYPDLKPTAAGSTGSTLKAAMDRWQTTPGHNDYAEVDRLVDDLTKLSGPEMLAAAKELFPTWMSRTKTDLAKEIKTRLKNHLQSRDVTDDIHLAPDTPEPAPEMSEHVKATDVIHERAAHDPALSYDDIKSHVESLANMSKNQLRDVAKHVYVTAPANVTKGWLLDQIYHSIANRKGRSERTKVAESAGWHTVED